MKPHITFVDGKPIIKHSEPKTWADRLEIAAAIWYASYRYLEKRGYHYLSKEHYDAYLTVRGEIAVEKLRAAKTEVENELAARGVIVRL